MNDENALVTPALGNDAMMAALERLARDPTVPTERIVTLYELAKERENTLMRREFMLAMNAFQRDIGQITKDKPNQFHSKYATEEQLDREARPVYTRHGFAVTFGTRPSEKVDYICVVCTVSHRGGWYEEHPLEGPVGTTGSQGGKMGATPIQAVGITVTYLKRDLIRMVLNLVAADNPTDNDGADGRDSDGKPLGPKEWLDRLELHLAAASTPEEYAAIATRRGTREALASATGDNLQRLQDMLDAHGVRCGAPAPDPFVAAAAGRRAAPKGGEVRKTTREDLGRTIPDDPPHDPETGEIFTKSAAFIQALATMDQIAINGLDTDAKHRGWLKDLSRAEYDYVAKAIERRVVELKGAAT